MAGVWKTFGSTNKHVFAALHCGVTTEGARDEVIRGFDPLVNAERRLQSAFPKNCVQAGRAAFGSLRTRGRCV
jgi:hypothetical protein